MPMPRRRGGSLMPSAGADTVLPSMLIAPADGFSRPAMQRSVVVLPQPEGPSNTTISPAGTGKLTPSTAGRPAANCLRRSRTSSDADMRASDTMVARMQLNARLLPVAVGLVPLFDPGCVQLHVLIEVRQPGLDHLGIETLRIDRRLPERGEVSELLDHEGLPFLRQAPVPQQRPSLRALRLPRPPPPARLLRT